MKIIFKVFKNILDILKSICVKMKSSEKLMDKCERI
jgi:hypothetical protein